MRLLPPCALALLALLAAAPPAIAADDPDTETGGGDPGYATPDDQAPGGGDEQMAPAPDAGGYEQALSPYGEWVDANAYGRVWRPAVSYGWRPYVDGYWAWTSYGWTWVSSEPWGWTFHYGRWALCPFGWVWVPGFVWGPAWVDWYWGDGFVGWAPLAPFASHVTVINHFVFVHEGEFCSHRLVHVVVDQWRVPHHVVDHWSRPGHRWRNDFRPPPRERIEDVSHHPVPHIEGRSPGTTALVPSRDRPRRDARLTRPGRVPRHGFETPAAAAPPPLAAAAPGPAAPGWGRPERRSGPWGAPRPWPERRPRPPLVIDTRPAFEPPDHAAHFGMHPAPPPALGGRVVMPAAGPRGHQQHEGSGRGDHSRVAPGLPGVR